MSEADELLQAARDALRCYQRGDTAPWIATRVADAIDRHFGRDPALPSLTPNEDAVRAGLAKRESLPLAEPEARNRRVTEAIGDARSIVMAQEFDRGGTLHDFLIAYVFALAVDLALMAKGSSQDAASARTDQLLLAGMLAEIRRQATLALADEGFGTDRSCQVEARPVSRA